MSNCNKTFRDMIESGQAQILGIVSEVPMGDWNATTTYQKLNFVRHNGATYKAKTSNTNVEPGVAQNWEDVWMLCNYDGGLVVPTGIYQDMIVGTALSLKKEVFSIETTQWENNQVVLPASQYPNFSLITENNIPVLIVDDDSTTATINSELTISLNQNNEIVIECKTVPNQTISGIIYII